MINDGFELIRKPFLLLRLNEKQVVSKTKFNKTDAIHTEVRSTRLTSFFFLCRVYVTEIEREREKRKQIREKNRFYDCQQESSRRWHERE
jgi:hypothetical protein